MRAAERKKIEAPIFRVLYLFEISRQGTRILLFLTDVG